MTDQSTHDASQRMTAADERDAVKAASTPATGIYTDEYDAHYRALWEGSLGHPADRTFDQARPAYQLGHIAAYQPEYVGRDFAAAEPSLRSAWSDDLRSRYGEWDSVRSYVRDAYGHVRSEGVGVRRGSAAIGTGGTAVDPVELERARTGLPSRDDEQDAPTLSAIDRVSLSTRGDLTAAPDEIGANEAHRDRLARG